MNRPGRLLLAVALLAVPACSGDSGGPVAGTAVEMVAGHAFEPASLEVSAGDTVTFTNESAESHTVTAYEERIPPGADYFASGGFATETAARDEIGDGLVKQDGTYELTFEEPGTYEYFCIPHEGDGMKGTIVVNG